MYKFMQKYGASSIEDLSKMARQNPDWFWSSMEKYLGLVWDVSYNKISDSTNGIKYTKWFVDGKTNIYSSSVEKFTKIHPTKIAYHFISEDGTISQLSYSELDRRVTILASALSAQGVKKGDVVAIYMPMIEEAILAILAAAKIGAIQTVIFSGYGSESLKIRLDDCKAKVLFVTDGFYRKGKAISHKSTVKYVMQNTQLEKIILVKYKKIDTYDISDGVIFYDDFVKESDTFCGTIMVKSEDPLFVLYTSGTTGTPKGAVHVHGGFSVFAGYQSAFLIDMTSNDILFWPADIGWITGLVWNIYGLLLVGASAIIYDGALDYPDSNLIWRILSRYDVTIFGTSPTTVRMLRSKNTSPDSRLLQNLKNIPTTGEPIDEDSWRWLYEKVGSRRIPIMNLAGGTEIGGAMLSVFPGMKLKPSTVGVPIPGMHLDVFDDNGNSVRGKDGFLVVRSLWPAMTRSLLNDDKRFLETYWSRFNDIWFHGDYVYVDSDNLWYMRGRADDIINVSGHRMSTIEIEHAVLTHDDISDAAAISIPDDITGESIVVFFVTNKSEFESKVSDYISIKLGKIAKPKLLFQLSELPRTRTGKIMRRLLRSTLLGEDLGDLSSLENPKVLKEISQLKF